MPDQPMGRMGIVRGRFEDKATGAVQEVEARKRELFVEADQLETELRQNGTLRILAEDVAEGMKKAYLATPEGQAQYRLIRILQVRVDPDLLIDLLAKNQARLLMGVKLRAIMDETPAAP